MTISKKIDQAKEVALWHMRGRNGSPPHSIKQRVLLDYAQSHNLSYFVETGTHSGAMVNAMRGNFDHIYSIELSNAFYQSASNWFKNDETVTIVNGDSGVELGGIVKKLEGPALFWLDGHFSAGKTARADKDTPILEELEHIYSDDRFRHVVVIDDARLFGVDPEYPTIEEIKSLLIGWHVACNVFVEYDAIRILPS